MSSRTRTRDAAADALLRMLDQPGAQVRLGAWVDARGGGLGVIAHVRAGAEAVTVGCARLRAPADSLDAAPARRCELALSSAEFRRVFAGAWSGASDPPAPYRVAAPALVEPITLLPLELAPYVDQGRGLFDAVALVGIAAMLYVALTAATVGQSVLTLAFAGLLSLQLIPALQRVTARLWWNLVSRRASRPLPASGPRVELAAASGQLSLVVGSRVVGVVDAEAVTFAWRAPRGDGALRVVARVDGVERGPIFISGVVELARARELPRPRRELPERADFSLAREAMDELVAWVSRRRRLALHGAPSRE